MENIENKEVFKQINGYPSYYISNKGRIWRGSTQRYLKPSEKPNGYMQVNMVAANGKRKKEYVHRLVAIAFIDNPEGKTEVDHIDRNPANNNVENLRWATRSENCRNKQETKTVRVYDLENNLIGEFPGATAAAEATGVSISSVYPVLRGDFDSCKGYKFIYMEV